MKFSCVQRASSANCSWGRGHGVAPRREGDRLTVRRGAPRTLEIDSGPGHGRLRADADFAGANDPDRTHNAAARRRDAGQRVQEPRRGPARVLRHRAGPEGSTGHQGNPARLTPPATLSSCQRLPLRSLAHAARRRRRRLRSPDPCGPWPIPLLIRRAGGPRPSTQMVAGRYPPPCGCREPRHIMRPAHTRVEGRRAGLVATDERSLRRAGECGRRAVADRAIGAGGECCSARRTPRAPVRGGVVR
jgi:hypothetical protein